MATVIAIVDDEKDILDLVAIHLRRSGYDVHGFLEPASFFRFIERHTPALIILDLMLPGIGGFEVCKRLKRDPNRAAVPVIMLTAKSEETDKVLGLELGADDYVTKPFSPRELVARVKAVLRRQAPAPVPVSAAIGGTLTIDPEKFEVRAGGRSVALTTTEFKILQLLAGKPGVVFTREQMLDHLWGQDKIVIDRTIDVHIRHLRIKLGNEGNMIRNIRGVGYKLQP
jgi:two-component system phosphate regulon response regulator PhoB/two-component system alkaline phosphatase synthesis response regulator PhoP